MLAISRNIFILFSAGLMLLLVGCGVSTADVDATVQARIASIPTPTPQIVIQEVEVIVEVEKEVVKEVEKIVEKLVEVEVEKIVEVVVTATPTPLPTATPTSTPLPAAKEFISYTTRIGTALAADKQDLVHVGISEDEIKDVTYEEVLVTNSHPSKPIGVDFDIITSDSEGNILSSRTTFKPCIAVGETQLFRYPKDDNKSVEIKSADYCENSQLDISIDESLLDAVSITKIRDIYNPPWWSYEVKVYNVFPTTLNWLGELLIKDLDGNVVYRERVNAEGKPTGATEYGYNEVCHPVKPDGKIWVKKTSWRNNRILRTSFRKNQIEDKSSPLFTTNEANLLEPEFKTVKLHICD